VNGPPRVSIVMPLFNDEEFVAAAITSCLRQSLADIEVICVDDASTDSTADIVEGLAHADPRVRLIRQPANRSAFEARRAGILAATAPFVLFLDGDDQLAPRAAEMALRAAHAKSADVVGFGVSIVTDDSPVPGRFQAALQPKFKELVAPAIVPALFPVGEVANGHLWRYLFARHLLERAYAPLSSPLAFYRANDLPVSLLALTYARKYVSIPERLYQYHFRRGTSGHRIGDVDRFRFLMSGIDPITAVRDAVAAAVEATENTQATLDSYESARLHIIGSVLRSCLLETSGELQRTCLELLEAKVGRVDLVRAGAAFCGEALPAIARLFDEPTPPSAPIKSVLLMTAHLDTGGLQAVLIDQAVSLVAAGYLVTIAVRRGTERSIALPESVEIVVLNGGLLEHLDQLTEICRDRDVDAIIDHHILYNDIWPWYALVALTSGVPMIGWMHNFALRPIFDHSQRASFLAEYARLLLVMVTLSSVDVAYWKLQGVARVVHLPDPAPPLARAALATTPQRDYDGGRLELAWWGRLDGPTKQVDHLIAIATELRARGVDFRMRIIGPDSKNLHAHDLREAAVAAGVEDVVELLGERDPHELLTVLSDTDLLVSTSAIEGFQLTIVEAQAMGMPVVMYDLPWLATVRGNPGVITSAPNDPGRLAEEITRLANDPARLSELSRASRAHAASMLAVDVPALLVALLTDDLPSEYSPQPTLDDARVLLQWMVRYSERSIRSGRRERSSYAELRKDLKLAHGELRHIKSGPSFRVGRALTLIPRTIRALVGRMVRTSRKAT